jgi:hypothetical protein
MAPPVPAEGRSLEYSDIEQASTARSVPLPAPPADRAPEFVWEQRLMAVLSDGGRTTSARPLASWDVAISRVWYDVNIIPIYNQVCFVSVGRNASLCLETGMERELVSEAHITAGGQSAGPCRLKPANVDWMDGPIHRWGLTDCHPPTHPKMSAPTDFNGDGLPDVAVGFVGGLHIYQLHDDPAEPVAARQTVQAGVDVPIINFTAYYGPGKPYTQWPCDLVRACVRVHGLSYAFSRARGRCCLLPCHIIYHYSWAHKARAHTSMIRQTTLKDLDGDGVDELWTGAKQLAEGWATSRANGAYLLTMQASDSGTRPVRATGPIVDSSYGSFFGEAAVSIGDVDGDGHQDVLAMVEVGDDDTPQFAIFYLSGDPLRPYKRHAAVGLDETTHHWLRAHSLVGFRGDEDGRKIGFGLSTVPDIQFAAPKETLTIRGLLLYDLGELLAEEAPGARQILVGNVLQADEAGERFRQFNLILTPTVPDYSQTRLVGVLGDPRRGNGTAGDTWAFQTLLPGPAPGGGGGNKAEAAAGTAAMAGGLLATDDTAYAFACPMVSRSFVEPLRVLPLPRPLAPAAFPRGAYREPILLCFDPPVHA